MPRIPHAGLIGAEYQARSRYIDVQDLVNMYPETEDQRSKNVLSLIGCAGLKPFVDLRVEQPLINGGIRGLHSTATGRAYCVCSNAVFELFSGGSAKLLGKLETSVGRVSMADNGGAVALLDGSGVEGDQLFITDGKNGYVFQMSTGIQLSVSSVYDQIKGTSVVFKDGYFIVNRPNTGQFYISGLYDGTSWDGAVWYTAEGSPDDLVKIAKSNNELWLFGSLSTEVWYNAGGGETGDPLWRRIQGAFLDIGTDAPDSVASIGSSMFWLGSNTRGIGSVWTANGFSPVRISTHAIELMIGKMDRIDDAIGYCYQQEGHLFYVLNFLTANKTLVFDQSTGLWHQRAYYNEGVNVLLSHRGICSTTVFGKVLVGDHSLTKVYEYDLDCYTDDGAKIIRRRTFPHTADGNKYVFYHELEVEMEKGAGDVVGNEPENTTGINDDFSTYPEGVFDSDSGTIWNVNKKSSRSGDLYIRIG